MTQQAIVILEQGLHRARPIPAFKAYKGSFPLTNEFMRNPPNGKDAHDRGGRQHPGLLYHRGQTDNRRKRLADMESEWIVPTVWCVEFQSILWKYVRFGGMSTEKALELLDQAIDLFSVNQMTPPPDMVLRNAIAWGITVYDARYVSLAKQVGVRCITEDVPVQKACPGVALSIKDFINRDTDSSVVRERQATYRTRRTSKARKGLSVPWTVIWNKRMWLETPIATVSED